MTTPTPVDKGKTMNGTKVEVEPYPAEQARALMNTSRGNMLLSTDTILNHSYKMIKQSASKGNNFAVVTIKQKDSDAVITDVIDKLKAQDYTVTVAIDEAIYTLSIYW
mgnify:CR=1 FL=1